MLLQLHNNNYSNKKVIIRIKIYITDIDDEDLENRQRTSLHLATVVIIDIKATVKRAMDGGDGGIELGAVVVYVNEVWDWENGEGRRVCVVWLLLQAWCGNTTVITICCFLCTAVTWKTGIIISGRSHNRNS